MGIELEFCVILDKKENNYSALKTYIKDFLKKQKIFDYLEQNDREVFFFNFFTTKENFSILENEINELYSIFLSDITNIMYPHYHLTRYRDISDTEEYEIVHESIAVNLEQGYWEIYYQDGNLEGFSGKSGSLKNYGIFLFDITIKEDDDFKTAVENAFDTWLQNNS
ncbi:hypothetical protein EYB33_12270 [Lysinibacillus sphaericus]|uniref:hypothetical protein n=1 Tax=Lysinibacillus TaxID=400634 RepID=UPI00084B8D2B|nr:hypothetical protein [Lysinibacillus sphaericus]OEC01260.1 hypothetical protein GY31_13205 [Lysinibacillus sphaericus]UDK97032.1 hypothetical protein EYB33_12270 [Lysinibacillus sphaericus]